MFNGIEELTHDPRCADLRRPFLDADDQQPATLRRKRTWGTRALRVRWRSPGVGRLRPGFMLISYIHNYTVLYSVEGHHLKNAARSLYRTSSRNYLP